MYVFFDIGGTKMRFSGSSDLLHIGKPIIRKTPEYYEDGIVQIKEIIEEVSENEVIQGFVGGIAGVTDHNKEKLLTSPNLPGWINKPLKHDLSRMIGITPEIFNDTDLACLGEATYGVAKEYRIVAYITVSTGVGGSLTIDDKIVPYRFGREPGFQIIKSDTLKTLEDAIGGNSIFETYGKKSEDISENKADGELWDDLLDELVVGLHNTIVHWSPDIMVLGGSQMNSIKIETIKEKMNKIMKNYPEVPEMKLSELGDLNGLYGALAYTKQDTEN